MCTVLGFAHRKLSGWFQHNPGRLSLRNKASRSANGRHWNGALTDKIKQCCKQTLVIATVGEMEARACFEALPNEILFHIFASLDARFVVDVVARVCRRFALVLSDSSFWKAKLFHRWPKPYPVTPADTQFDWREACVEREQHFKQWSDWEIGMKRIRVCQPHIGFLHSVLLMNKGSICATGSRDHDLKVWDVKDRDDGADVSSDGTRLLHSVVDAHSGWLWSLHCADDNTLLSSSFDKTLKFWDLGRNLYHLNSLTFDMPVLSICNALDHLVFGTFDGSVFGYDPREAPAPALWYQRKGSEITCMASDEHTLIFGNRRGHLCVFDLRSRKPRQQLRRFSSFPSALSMDSRQLWVGSRGGVIHIVDMTSGKAEQLQCVDLKLAKRHNVTTSIHHSLGSVLVCLMDSPVYVLEPNLNPELISRGALGQSVSRLHVDNGVLATVGQSGLEVWRPRSLE